MATGRGRGNNNQIEFMAERSKKNLYHVYFAKGLDHREHEEVERAGELALKVIALDIGEAIKKANENVGLLGQTKDTFIEITHVRLVASIDVE